MRICLAQLRSETGNVPGNTAHHLAALRQLETQAGDLVAFPELSLSNYDPEAAVAVAMSPDDRRLADFQHFANETGVTIAVGAPIVTRGRPLIAMLVFAQSRRPLVVGKRHLHPDELPWFSPADEGVSVVGCGLRIGMAICHELTVAAHAESLMSADASVYLATVAKTASGVAAALPLLMGTAQRHRIPVLMVNGIGMYEGRPAGGGSMALASDGTLLARLDGSSEGVLTYDTETASATTRIL